MTETAGPDRVRSAEQIGLSAREAAAAPVPHATGNAPPRDAASWARKVDRLEVDPRAGVRGTNVAGRRLTGPGKITDVTVLPGLSGIGVVANRYVFIVAGPVGGLW